MKSRTSIADLDAIPANIGDFCKDHAVVPYFETALKLVKKCFRPKRIRFQVEGDPEGDGEWLVIEVDVPADVNEVLRRNSRFSKQWATSGPWKKRGLIRVLYNII